MDFIGILEEFFRPTKKKLEVLANILIIEAVFNFFLMFTSFGAFFPIIFEPFGFLYWLFGRFFLNFWYDLVIGSVYFIYSLNDYLFYLLYPLVLEENIFIFSILLPLLSLYFWICLFGYIFYRGKKTALPRTKKVGITWLSRGNAKLVAKYVIIIILFGVLVFNYLSSADQLYFFQNTDTLIQRAIQNKDLSYCEEIIDQHYKNQCFFNLSQYVPEACGHIKADYYFKFAYDDDKKLLGECYLGLYDKYMDEKYCLDMQFQGCYYDQIEYCYKRAGYSGDDLCKKFKLSFSNYETCYTRQNITINISAAICQYFGMPLYMAYPGLIESRNLTSSAFTKIPYDNARDCYSKLALITENASFCRIIYLLEEFYVVKCVNDIAQKKNDETICDNIPGYYYVYCTSDECTLTERLYCKYKINPDKYASFEFCENVPNKASCIGIFAAARNNISICEVTYGPNDGVIGTSYRDVCYLSFAISTKNESYCEKIVGKETYPKKHSCYIDVAEAKQDPQVCDNLLNLNVGPQVIEYCKEKAS